MTRRSCVPLTQDSFPSPSDAEAYTSSNCNDRLWSLGSWECFSVTDSILICLFFPITPAWMEREKLIVTQPGARTYNVMHFNRLGWSAVHMCVRDQYKSAHNPLVYRKRTGHFCETGGVCSNTHGTRRSRVWLEGLSDNVTTRDVKIKYWINKSI